LTIVNLSFNPFIDSGVPFGRMQGPRCHRL
jgi:hypothetical protein